MRARSRPFQITSVISRTSRLFVSLAIRSVARIREEPRLRRGDEAHRRSAARSAQLIARAPHGGENALSFRLVRFVAERGEERLLLAAGHDVDAVPAADLLAQAAADAGLLVDDHLAEVLREIARRGAQAVERADVDADAAAVAVVGVDDRERALGALQHARHVPVGVEDRL